MQPQYTEYILKHYKNLVLELTNLNVPYAGKQDHN